MPAWEEYVKYLVALLVIVNPLGAVPVFLGLVEGQSQAEQDRSARVAATAVAITLIAALLGGEAVLRFFGIGLPAFRVGGGIVILLMAVAMLHATPSGLHQTPEEAAEAAEKEAVAVVPLAIPLLAGPGAISTVILAAQGSTGWLYSLVLATGPILLALTLWLCLRFAVPIGRRLGKTGVNIATRLMGLILAAIAVEFIAQGLTQLFPALAGGG